MNPVAKWLKRVETSYRLGLGSPVGCDALADLRKFCFATQSPIGATTEETYRNLGRQEVFQRIATNLNLTIEDIYGLNEEIDDE